MVDPDKKVCPKCSTVMNPSQLVLGIPAAVVGGTPKAITDQQAYPVVAWACPRCHYVELYYAGPRV